MRALTSLSLLFVVLAACGGGPGTTPDAAGDDDPEIDAMVVPPDAEPPAPDAEPGPNDVTSVCVELCVVISECFGGGGSECLNECGADLGDCSQTQLDDLHACGDDTCRTLIDCVLAVDCVEQGNKSSCGDGTCDPDEDCGTCAEDCGECVCGDGTCSLGECSTCATDCPGGCVCPHDSCTEGEALDPGCGECAATVCEADEYCCTTGWDTTCVIEAEKFCGKECMVEPGVDAGVPDVDASVPDDAGVFDGGAPPSPPAPARQGFLFAR